jgi:ADP-ribose pyrophosphatase
MNTDQIKNPWHRLSSKEIYDNPWIRLREDAVIRPDGKEGIYGVVHFKNVAVGVLPIEDDYIYLVGQYRYPLEAYSWEIPEGGCPEHEDTLEAAKRELEEETGLLANRWEKLGDAHLSNSVSDERAIWYLATELTHGTFNPEGCEQLSLRRIPFKEALQMVLNGEITDSLSMLAILSYQLKSEL